MDIIDNFSALFGEVWEKGILGVDIFQIIIGLGIFLIFLLFRGLISKIIINRLKKIAKKTTNKLDDTFVQAQKENILQLIMFDPLVTQEFYL